MKEADVIRLKEDYKEIKRATKGLVAYLMKKYNVPKENVIRHFDVTGKICPNGYINKDSWRWLHSKLTGSVSSSNKQSIPRGNLKSIDEVAREVINGRWGNGADRAQKLRNAGYNYDLVQKRVNEILGNKPKLKSIDEVAREVINGKWGNGSDRVNRLTKAGYDYNAVQRRVNEILR